MEQRHQKPHALRGKNDSCILFPVHMRYLRGPYTNTDFFQVNDAPSAISHGTVQPRPGTVSVPSAPLDRAALGRCPSMWLHLFVWLAVYLRVVVSFFFPGNAQSSLARPSPSAGLSGPISAHARGERRGTEAFPLF